MSGTMTASERANLPRWRGQAGFVEIWFLVVFHPPTESALWLRYTTFAPARGAPGADNPPAPVRVDCLRRFPVHFVRPWHLYLPRSAGGDCRMATAEKGAAIRTAAIDALAEFLKELSAAPWSPTFPY